MKMFTDGANIYPKKLGDFLLIEPKSLGLVKNLDSDIPLLGMIQNKFAAIGCFGFKHTILREKSK